jgi:hypothetical protein
MQTLYPKAIVGKVPEGLSLPVLESNRGIGRGNKNNFWKSLTYTLFAHRLQRQNSDTVLTKHVVDTAFRSVVEHMSENTRTWSGRESAIARVRLDVRRVIKQC